MLEFLLVSNFFSISTAELMAKCKARSPHTSVSSCFRHYKQKGKCTLAVPLKATPVYQCVSGGFPRGYSAKCRHQLNFTGPSSAKTCHRERPDVLSLLKKSYRNKKQTTGSVNKQGKRVFATRYCTLQTNFQ